MSGSLILAGASVRSLAESALACGITPYCVDLFADADLRLILKERGGPAPLQIDRFSAIPAAIEHLGPENPVIWTGGLENDPHTLQQIGNQRPVLGATSECLDELRSPAELRALLVGTGCRAPEIVMDRTASSNMADRAKWLIKPILGSGGLGIRNLDGKSHVRDDEFCQQHVSGLSVSALYVHSGPVTHMLGACLQIIGDPALGGDGYRFCGTIGPIQLPDTVLSIVNEVGCKIGSTKIRGIFGADFIVRDDEVWLIEINPRITASHESYDYAWKKSVVLQRHLASWGNDLRSDMARSLPMQSHRVLARLVVYVKQNRTLDESDVNRLLKFRRSTRHHRGSSSWVADIPMPGDLAVGQPFCSVYHVLRRDRSAWTIETGLSEVTRLDAMLASLTGVRGLDTATTAIRHGSLFQSAILSDNG